MTLIAAQRTDKGVRVGWDSEGTDDSGDRYRTRDQKVFRRKLHTGREGLSPTFDVLIGASGAKRFRQIAERVGLGSPGHPDAGLYPWAVSFASRLADAASEAGALDGNAPHTWAMGHSQVLIAAQYSIFLIGPEFEVDEVEDTFAFIGAGATLAEGAWLAFRYVNNYAYTLETIFDRVAEANAHVRPPWHIDSVEAIHGEWPRRTAKRGV